MWQQTNLKGETPLFVAVEKCLVQNVHFLLLNGFSPDVKNEEGDSALFVGKQYNRQLSRVLFCLGFRVDKNVLLKGLF